MQIRHVRQIRRLGAITRGRPQQNRSAAPKFHATIPTNRQYREIEGFSRCSTSLLRCPRRKLRKTVARTGIAASCLLGNRVMLLLETLHFFFVFFWRIHGFVEEVWRAGEPNRDGVGSIRPSADGFFFASRVLSFCALIVYGIRGVVSGFNSYSSFRSGAGLCELRESWKSRRNSHIFGSPR